MARPLRIEFEDAFYHITARGNERREIYQSRSDYQREQLGTGSHFIDLYQ